MSRQTFSSYEAIPHILEWFQHSNEFLSLLGRVFRQVIFLFLVTICLLGHLPPHLFLLHLNFSVLSWFLIYRSYGAISLFREYPHFFLVILCSSDERGWCDTERQDHFLVNWWCLVEKLEIITWNACVSSSCINRCASWSIVKWGPSYLGSSWNDTAADDLTRTNMRVCGETTVFMPNEWSLQIYICSVLFAYMLLCSLKIVEGQYRYRWEMLWYDFPLVEETFLDTSVDK